MSEPLDDPRFKHIPSDPKFRRIPKKERKVKIDARFSSMLTDKKFAQKYSYDKRGRPLQQTSTENLKKFYDLSSDDDDAESAVESESETKSSKKSKEAISQSPGGSKKKRKSLKEKINTKQQQEDENETVEETEKIKNTNDSGKYVKLISNSTDENEEIDSDDDNIGSDLETNKNQLKIGIKGDAKKINSAIHQKLKDLTVDYARGEGLLLSDSSSDDDTTTDDEDDSEIVDHAWGELDKEAETTEEATARLAACNMDWDKIRAVDLMVVFNSFVPPGGCVQSVTIYPSEFGTQRMKDEDIRGPMELINSYENKKMVENNSNVDLKQTVGNCTNDDAENSNTDDEDHQSIEDFMDKKSEQLDDDDNEDEGSDYHMEKMRQYQLNRLKYYYAVIVFDSAQTANTVYTQCDGIEYEATATKFDLRFIPDDMDFDQEPKEICDKLPELPKYQPRQFTTTALQQVKVELTWDETKPERLEIIQKLNSGKFDDIDKNDLQAYVACGSSDEESDGKDNNELGSDTDDNKQPHPDKYRSIFKDILQKEEDKKKKDIELEFTWGVGTKEKAEKLVKESLKKKDLTPFEKYVEKRKEKLKEKRNKRKNLSKEENNENTSDSDDSIPSDVDMNDPYFAEEYKSTKVKTKKTKKSKNHAENNSEDENNKAQLELLLLDEENEADKHHFNMKTIEEGELLTKSKKKRLSKKKKEQKEAAVEDNFQVNVSDPRFTALYTSHLYNIDPADPHYRKTKGTEALVNEKLKRRANEDVEVKINLFPLDTISTKKKNY